MKKILIKVVFLAVLLTGISGFGFSQDKKSAKEGHSFFDRVSIGGSVGASFGSDISLLDLSPTIGYWINDNWIAGIGVSYKFYRYKNYYWNYRDSTYHDLRTNIFGGSVWSRYFLIETEMPLIENIFLHAEIEPLVFQNDFSNDFRGDYIDYYGNTYSRQKQTYNLFGVFLGGGLQQPLGGRSYLYLEVLWNFNEELYSPYSNPRIRMGFAAGL